MNVPLRPISIPDMFAENLSASFRLVGQSFRVLARDKELIVLPALGGLVSIAAQVAMVFAFGLLDEGRLDSLSEPVLIAIGFVELFVTYSIAVFFQAAVVAGADERLRGGNPTIGSALSKATSRIGVLLQWACAQAVIGVAARAARRQGQTLTQVVTGLAEIAWAIATYFVVPALVLERESDLRGSFKRSWDLIQQRWGMAAIGAVGLDVAFLATLAVACSPAAFLLFGLDQPIPALVVGVAAASLVIAVYSALDGIWKTALYRYARDGQYPRDFDSDLVSGAFEADFPNEYRRAA